MKQPRYQAIAQELLTRYRGEGETLLPVQRELAEVFGVTRLTVRHAFEWLEKQGAIHRIPGRGYVLLEEGAQESGVADGAAAAVVVGMPIWADSFLDLEPLRMMSTLQWMEAAREHLRRNGMKLETPFIGPQHRPDYALLGECARRWSAVILQAPRVARDWEMLGRTPLAEIEHQVFIGMVQANKANSVYPDLFHATRAASQWLARQGASRLLYTGVEGEIIPHLMAREIGAQSGIGGGAGLELLYSGGGSTFERAYSSVKQAFQQGVPFDAVLANNGHAAAGALRAIADEDLRLLWKIPLIGIGKRYYTDYMVPRPAMMVSGDDEIGREAGRMTVGLVSGTIPFPASTVIPVHFVPGDDLSVLGQGMAFGLSERAVRAEEERRAFLPVS